MEDESPLFPFTKIVGQEKMKRALLLNVIDPGIGGVLIKGEKGTAKSTAVRSLAQILPFRENVSNCPFRCDLSGRDGVCPYCKEKIERGEILESARAGIRVVELPLSATEDRVAGTLDVEHILRTGEKKFEPGILAQANGNILYVDEVNLLDDHLVDLLLDSAAMGVNYIEREGVSFSHPSRFILVGTMNPEEGDLRPQLLDRFGLSVDVKGEKDPKTRAEVVRRRLIYDGDPGMYVKENEKEIKEITERVVSARSLIKKIDNDDRTIDMVVEVTAKFGVDGHRADITMVKASKANAAFEGRVEVTKDDIRQVADLVLSHRVKRRPFENSVMDMGELEECLQAL
jgi:magnesium chelatase subunit I